MSGVTNQAGKPRRRDRFLRPFESWSRRRPSPSPSPVPSAAGTSTPVQSPSSTPSATTPPKSTSQRIVDQALQQLSDHQRTILRPFLSSSTISASDALERCLAETRQMQRAWDDGRWTVTFGTRTITFKEEVDKIMHWLDRFKAVGDMAVNVDPIHAGLPWAGVRFLLELAISDDSQMAALLVGCETVMYMINRLKAYVDFLSRMPVTLTQANFEDALTAMHALVLAFLAGALEKYHQSTLRRAFSALWQVSEVQDFERKCNDLAIRLEIEASNCDRTMAEHDRDMLRQTYQDLQKALRDIAQIHSVQATLDRLEKKLDLSRLKTVEGATFDSYSQIHRGCHKDTRVDLLRSIQDWTNQPDSKSIFWLSGMAGTGKSTISWTIAKWLADQGTSAPVSLGASFFFKRGEGDRGSAALLFPTLAHQLAKKIDGLDVLLARTVDDYPDIASKSLGEQFAKLIRDPLSQLFTVLQHPIYVIVVDALDECEVRDIGTILQLWAALPQFANNCLRLFLTSRPDLPVLTGFDEISVNVRIDASRLQDVPLPVVERDILVFLRSELTETRKKYNRRPLSGVPLEDDWPGETTVRELAEMATPLFIVAATMCLFISDPHWDPNERLMFFLDHRKIGHLSRMAQTYLPVLKQITTGLSDPADKDQLYHEFRTVVGAIVTLAEPLSRSALAFLLGMPVGTVTLRLQPLHSVLEIPSDTEALVRPLHLSFSEYLTSQELHQEPFGVDAPATHRMLWNRCLQVLSSASGLVENICGLTHPGQLRRTVDLAQVKEHFPSTLQYACRYWVHHVQLSGSRLHDQDEIHAFLRKHFIHWLEALSFLDRLAEAIGFVQTLRSHAAVDNSDVAQFLDDAYRFVLTNKHVGELAPLQLYSSAVIFAPQNSIVRNVCGQKPAWVLQSPTTPLIWNQELQKLEGHTKGVTAVAFSHNSLLLASASHDETVRLWNPSTGQEIHTLEGHTESVTAVSFSNDDSLLASASGDMTVRLWNLSTGQEIQMLDGHTRGLTAVSFSHDGSLLASASDDETVRLWNVSTGQEVQKLEGYTRGSRRTVRLWNLSTRQEIRTFEGHTDAVNAVAFSFDGSLLASASDDRTVRLWNQRTGQDVQILEGHTKGVTVVTFSHNGSFLASASDETVRLWNVSTGQEIQKLEGHIFWVNAVAFSHDDSLLASVSHDSTVRLWNPSTRQEIQALEGHIDTVNAMAFSHDGSLLASASDDRTVRLWNPRTGKEVQTLERHTNYVVAVAFSHDGSLLVSASGDKTVRLWNLSTSQEIHTLEGHTDRVTSVAFSHDGSLLASASADKTVRLWNLSTGQEIQTLKGHTKWVVAVAFSHDGSLLASASWDKTVRLWNPSTRQEIQTLEGHTDRVTSVAFSHDSSLLASASADKTVRLWSLPTGQEIRTLSELDYVTDLRFVANDQGLLTHRGPIRLKSTSCYKQDQEPYSDALVLRGEWVEYEGKQILWLPQEYRISVSTTFQNQLVFGQKSGSVTFLRVGYEQTVNLD